METPSMTPDTDKSYQRKRNVTDERTSFYFASGIFNGKGNTDPTLSELRVFHTIDKIVTSPKKGVVCKILMSWWNPLLLRDFCYAPPDRLLEYRSHRQSRWIDVSPDYDMLEFSVPIRLDRPAPQL
jgi:hypothetical protein